MGESTADFGLTTKRIETLTDGIFAIAMTLLVLSINLPEVGAEVGLHQLLFSQWYKFVNYAVSFMLLSVFWVVHHQQFCFIKRTDRHHLWISILVLMFIAMIPFSASLIGDYSNDSLAKIFFAGNLFIIGMLFYVNWAYATHKHRLVEKDLDIDRIEVGKRRSLVTPAVALAAAGLSLLHPSWSFYAYLSIPVILSFPPFRHKG